MLSDTKDFYHLCRKYKYYYNAYEQVKHLKNVYWSKYIKDAHNEIISNLKKVENEMIDLMLDDLIGSLSMVKIEKSKDMQGFAPIHKRAIIDNPKLVDALEKRKQRQCMNIMNNVLTNANNGETLD